MMIFKVVVICLINYFHGFRVAVLVSSIFGTTEVYKIHRQITMKDHGMVLIYIYLLLAHCLSHSVLFNLTFKMYL